LSKKSSGSKSLLSAQAIVLMAIGWAFISLLFFLLFSDFIPTQGFPTWYGVATYILEEVAFLGATILCFRNWRSSQIVSGRTVWLLLGLGMGSFFIGNLILAYWELILGKEPDVSPGDIFFLLTYLFMGIGMLLAVFTRRLNLSVTQWGTVVAIGIAGVVIAYYTSVAVPEELAIAPSGPRLSLVAPAYATDAPAETPATQETAPAAPAESVTEPVSEPTEPAAEPAPADAADPAATETAPATVAEEAVDENVPGWAIAAETFLSPYADIIAWLYILGDILLLIMATMLLLAFWGGRFSTSWRFIAASAFSFYIADIWFNFAISYIPAYQTGALLEVFWIFSAVLVSIGAALEYDLSTRSRRTSRRRGAP
jgi:hypothetical protein